MIPLIFNLVSLVEFILKKDIIETFKSQEYTLLGFSILISLAMTHSHVLLGGKVISFLDKKIFYFFIFKSWTNCTKFS